MPLAHIPTSALECCFSNDSRQLQFHASELMPISTHPSLLLVCTLLLPEHNHHQPHTTCVSPLPLSQATQYSCSNEKQRGRQSGFSLLPLLSSAAILTKRCLSPLSKNTAGAI